MIVVSAIGFILVLMVKLVYDFRLWKQELYAEIKHKKEWFYTAAALAPFCFTMSMAKAVPVTGYFVFAFAVSSAICAFAFWLLFDGLFNLTRGYKWFYTGTDDEFDSDTDNFIQRLPLWLHVCLKVGLTAISIIIYIKL